MKKVWKYSLFAIVSIILLITIYITYELKVKKHDLADAKVDALVNEEFTIDLPNGTKMIVDGQGNVLEDIKPEQEEITTYTIGEENIMIQVMDNKVTAIYDIENNPVNHEKIKPGNQVIFNDDQTVTIIDEEEREITTFPLPVGTIKPTPPPQVEEKVTVASIKSKYQGTVSAFETQAQSKINGLIGQAKAEYEAKKANGESISYSYFYKKYMGAANALEANTDASFEVLMGVVEKELEQNNFDKSYAESFRTEYTTSKKALRTEMLEKALSFK